jgi:integrase
VPGITKSGRPKKLTKSFSTKSEADEFAAKVNRKFRLEGFRNNSRILAAECASKRPSPIDADITLHEAGLRYIEAFERALENRGKRLKKDCTQKKRRANELLSSGDGNTDTYVSENTLRIKYAPAIRLLCDKNDLGAKLLSKIKRSDLEEHLNFLDLAISTYNDRTNLFDRFFKWCTAPRQGFIDSSPAAGLQKLNDEWTEPEILTVDEITRVFYAAEEIDPGIIPLLTLRAHAGLRTSESERIREDDLNWKYRFIDIRGDVAKRKSPDKPMPRKIEGLMETFWDWMKSVGGPDAKIDKVNRYKRLRAVFAEAGVFYKRNCLRHSFCSYAFALVGDDGRVRKWSGHRSPTAFYQNYVNVTLCTKKEAEDYFALTPSDNHVARLGKRHRRHQPTIAWPPDEEFVQMIAEMSNVKIAEKLHCTEAAVRKERKKRNL